MSFIQAKDHKGSEIAINAKEIRAFYQPINEDRVREYGIVAVDNREFEGFDFSQAKIDEEFMPTPINEFYNYKL